MSKNKWVNIHIILELAVIAVIIVMLTHPVDGKDYRRYETDTLNYVRATVQDVISEELEESPLQTGQQLGV